MGFIVIPGIDISDADAGLADVLNPRTFYSVAAPRKTGTMPTVALSPASNAYPAGYHVGAVNLQHIEPDLMPANIAAGITIFGVAGAYGVLNPYFGATIGGVAAARAIAAPNHTFNRNAPHGAIDLAAYADSPANYIRFFTPALASTDGETVIAAPDQTHNTNIPLASGLEILVDGFVEETALAVQTDKTAQARSAAANDINLPPFTTLADKIYIGGFAPFWQIWVNVGTNGAGNWANTCYYWNGAWTACVNETGYADFQSGTGWRRIEHSPQGDWALSIIQGMNLYWMKIECTAWVNEVTAPLGNQIFVAIA